MEKFSQSSLCFAPGGNMRSVICTFLVLICSGFVSGQQYQGETGKLISAKSAIILAIYKILFYR